MCNLHRTARLTQAKTMEMYTGEIYAFPAGIEGYITDDTRPEIIRIAFYDQPITVTRDSTDKHGPRAGDKVMMLEAFFSRRLWR